MFACCDESGIHSKSRWWSFGVLWLPDDALVPRFEADATALRQRKNCWGEFKWSKLSSRYLPVYSDFLSLALDLPEIRFTGLVVDTKLLSAREMKQYHAKGGKEEAYLKFMRLLVKERSAVMAREGHADFTLLYDKLSVGTDRRKTFRDVLQNDMRGLARTRRNGCKYVHLSQANSAVTHLMQAVDLLTGATYAAWEKTLEGGQGEARRQLCEQVEGWSNARLTNENLGWDHRLNIWRWRPG